MTMNADEIRRRFASALLSAKAASSAMSDESLGYSDSKEANAFIFSNPFAFLLGLIFDQGIQSTKAWKAPKLLSERLGQLDPLRISAMSEQALECAIANKPSLHRYPSVISRYVLGASQVVVEQFSGSATALWCGGLTVDQARTNLLLIPGIGMKKANLGVLMLWRDFGVQFHGIETLPMAVDVHLKRVFRRAGVLDSSGDEREFSRILGSLSSEPPAIFGTILWGIGQRYCHVTSPECLVCPLRHGCERNLSNG